MDRPRTVVGMPILDSVPGEAVLPHFKAIMEVARLCEMSFVTPLNTLPHDRARVIVTKAAKEFNADYVFFIDDDTLCPFDAFPVMLETLIREKAQVVSGHYLRRGYPYHCVWSKYFGDVPMCVDGGKDVIAEISCSGLGCALIDFKWLQENVQQPYFTMGVDGEATSVRDDVSFFDKVRLAGGKILGHGGVRCLHLGGRIAICDENADRLRSLSLITDEDFRANTTAGALEAQAG